MDLADQLILEHPMINVLLGGGQENFYPNNTPLPSDAKKFGRRGDGLHLADIWLTKLRDKGRIAEYVDNASKLWEVSQMRPDYLLGEW